MHSNFATTGSSDSRQSRRFKTYSLGNSKGLFSFRNRGRSQSMADLLNTEVPPGLGPANGSSTSLSTGKTPALTTIFSRRSGQDDPSASPGGLRIEHDTIPPSRAFSPAASPKTGGSQSPTEPVGTDSTTPSLAAIRAPDSQQGDVIDLSPFGVDLTQGVSTIPLATPPIIVSAPTPPECCQWCEDSAFMTVVLSSSAHEIVVARVDKRHPLAFKPKPKTAFRSTAQLLQRAARQVQAKGMLTRKSVSKIMLPFVTFIYSFAMTIFLMNNEAATNLLGLGDDIYSYVSSSVAAIFIGGFLLVLVTKLLVELVFYFFELFCDMDLEEAFRVGECVDSSGQRVGEAGLVIGNLLG